MPVSVRDGAGVADLAAALGVERRAVEEDRRPAVVAGRRRRAPWPWPRSPRGRRTRWRRGRRGAAGKLGAVGVDVALLAGLLGAACAAPAMRCVEAGEVDVDAALGGDLLGDLDREAEGVVQLERDVARAPAPARSASVVLEQA